MKTKVLYLITKSNWGGAQRYVYDLATGLPKDEFEAVVALGGAGPLAKKLQAAGIKVIALPSLQRDISLAKELRSASELWHIVKAERPDVLHSNSSKAGALGALIGRLAGVPRIIFTAHGWAFNEDRPWYQRIILKALHYWTVLASDQTIAVSQEVKRQLNWPLTAHKMTVIYNGRAIEGLKTRAEARQFLANLPAGEPLARLRDDFWSLTIAELHPIKRHDAVIAAMREVVRLWPQTRHIIIGAGQEEAQLRALIAASELEDHVFLLGTIPEAARYLRAADCFILASRSEALPYAIIEAAIAGLPIVATAVGGIPEILTNDLSGLLVPLSPPQALTEALLRLRADPLLCQRLAAGAAARGHTFQVATTLAKTTALYRSWHRSEVAATARPINSI